jgi:hypothetical protein
LSAAPSEMLMPETLADTVTCIERGRRPSMIRVDPAAAEHHGEEAAVRILLAAALFPAATGISLGTALDATWPEDSCSLSRARRVRKLVRVGFLRTRAEFVAFHLWPRPNRPRRGAGGDATADGPFRYVPKVRMRI